MGDHASSSGEPLQKTAKELTARELIANRSDQTTDVDSRSSHLNPESIGTILAQGSFSKSWEQILFSAKATNEQQINERTLDSLVTAWCSRDVSPESVFEALIIVKNTPRETLTTSRYAGIRKSLIDKLITTINSDNRTHRDNVSQWFRSLGSDDLEYAYDRIEAVNPQLLRICLAEFPDSRMLALGRRLRAKPDCQLLAMECFMRAKQEDEILSLAEEMVGTPNAGQGLHSIANYVKNQYIPFVTRHALSFQEQATVVVTDPGVLNKIATTTTEPYIAYKAAYALWKILPGGTPSGSVEQLIEIAVKKLIEKEPFEEWRSTGKPAPHCWSILDKEDAVGKRAFAKEICQNDPLTALCIYDSVGISDKQADYHAALDALVTKPDSSADRIVRRMKEDKGYGKISNGTVMEISSAWMNTHPGRSLWLGNLSGRSMELIPHYLVIMHQIKDPEERYILACELGVNYSTGDRNEARLKYLESIKGSPVESNFLGYLASNVHENDPDAFNFARISVYTLDKDILENLSTIAQKTHDQYGLNWCADKMIADPLQYGHLMRKSGTEQQQAILNLIQDRIGIPFGNLLQIFPQTQ